MTINWVVVVVLFCIGLPGVFIAMPRAIRFLLADSPPAVKRRFSYIAVGQALIMLFVMCLAGEILSGGTGLQDRFLLSLIQGHATMASATALILPAFEGALVALILFAFLYYGLVVRILDAHSLDCMRNLGNALGVWGRAQYGGISEEIIARWGLMNVTAFFMLIFVPPSHAVMWLANFASAIIFSVGLIPAYLAAGCVGSRRLVYSVVLLSVVQSLVFGYVFWQYGILCAVISHTLFHLGWSIFDKRLHLGH